MNQHLHSWVDTSKTLSFANFYLDVVTLLPEFGAQKPMNNGSCSFDWMDSRLETPDESFGLPWLTSHSTGKDPWMHEHDLT